MATVAAAGRTPLDLRGHRGFGEDNGRAMTKEQDGEPELRELFARVRARLKAAVGEDAYNSWFVRLELEEILNILKR